MIQLGSISDYPPDTLRKQLSGSFPSFAVKTLPPLADLKETFDSFRGQYHSTRLLVLLEKHIQTVPVNRLLGVSAFDLYLPGMNFVFGEARCPGRVAVISTRRLKSSSHDPARLFKDRVLKEAVHEIGHTLGLKHCPDVSCVMHFSEHIGDTDRKNAAFCEDCRSSLKRRKVE